MATTYIVITRNPSNKKLVMLQDEDDHPLEFKTENEAMECARRYNICRAWGAEIVPIAGMDVV